MRASPVHCSTLSHVTHCPCWGITTKQNKTKNEQNPSHSARRTFHLNVTHLQQHRDTFVIAMKWHFFHSMSKSCYTEINTQSMFVLRRFLCFFFGLFLGGCQYRQCTTKPDRCPILSVLVYFKKQSR